MKTRSILALTVSLLILCSACGPAAGQAGGAGQTGGTTSVAPAVIATVKEVSGTSEIRQPTDAAFSAAAVGMNLEQNGTIRTGADGRVRLDLSTGTIIRIAPSSLFTFVSGASRNPAQFKLDLGAIFTILNGGSVEVDTPSGQASVQGSYLGVTLDPATGDVIVTCLEGHCSAKNNAGIVDLTTGQMTSLKRPDPATGQYQIPLVGPMTAAEYQRWMDNSLEAGQAFDLSATLTAAAPTSAATGTPTETPTATGTPTDTPTPAVLSGVVQELSNCRYGPGAPYLYEYGIRAGATMQIIGRNYNGSWLYVQAPRQKNPCWINAELMQVNGDVMSLADVYPDAAPLPRTPYTLPPHTVSSARSGNIVTLSWSDTYRRPDLDPGTGQVKYVVEVWHCVGGQLLFDVYGTNDLSVEVSDEASCAQPSSARIFVQDKEGLTEPEAIPWPK
jgi:hypothetical protein